MSTYISFSNTMFCIHLDLKMETLNFKFHACQNRLGSSSFGLSAPESRDLSPSDTEITACKAEEIHKMTLKMAIDCHFVNLLSFASTYFFLSLRKIT
jgi:hypothetical protein